jgi:predicted lipoprotein with Yx(FWY)xxD motif
MRKILGAAGLAAIALAVAACGSSGSSGGAAAAASSSAPSSTAPSSSAPSTAAPSSSAPSSTAAAATGPLSTRTIDGKTVLTNSAGFTLYWFAPDTSTTSKCTGTCAQYWPPVKGPATAGAGVTGKLGTITRPDGSTQATYNGHPLYTYVADTAPGQAKGNGVNASGGLWYEVLASGSSGSGSSGSGSGSSVPASSPSASSGGGGGYGY